MSLCATGEGAGAAPGYRVVQWATGNIGTYALRSVLEHPDMTLAGVHVHSPAKAGAACEPLTLPRREPEGAVEADDLAVEIVGRLVPAHPPRPAGRPQYGHVDHGGLERGRQGGREP